jgi:uncharacterized membrane protein YphA (DoxX/SURF4 family)
LPVLGIGEEAIVEGTVTEARDRHQNPGKIASLARKRHFSERKNAVPLEPTISLLQIETPRVTQPSIWTKVVPWAAQIVVALILAQTLFFKFTYAPETQVIFANRGGRPAATALGVVELLCVILLLVPRTAAIGAALSLLVISGAIFTHLTSLGVQVVDPATGKGDGGLLFGLAVVVALGSAVVLGFRWRQLPYLSRLFPSA